MRRRRYTATAVGAAVVLVLAFALLFSIAGREETDLEIMVKENERVVLLEKPDGGQSMAPAGTLYNLVFYPPGKAPAGELEYDPIPFADLLPKWGAEQDVWDTQK